MQKYWVENVGYGTLWWIGEAESPKAAASLAAAYDGYQGDPVDVADNPQGNWAVFDAPVGGDEDHWADHVGKALGVFADI